MLECVHRLGRVAAVAAGFGVAAGAGGVLLADALSGPRRAVPTGPAVVLTATAVAVVQGPEPPVVFVGTAVGFVNEPVLVAPGFFGVWFAGNDVTVAAA